jgi:hypothetical protein
MVDILYFERVQKIISEFFLSTSKRKRLDNKCYNELVWSEYYIKERHIEFIEISHQEYDLINEFYANLTIQMKAIDKNFLKRNKVEINSSSLIRNEFNLYWEHLLIDRDFRGWAKKKTYLKYKNEILNSESLADLFYYNFKQEFDWNRSLNFISNRKQL